MAVEETIVDSCEEKYLSLPFWKKDLILFWSFFKIAAIVVGGGYAIIAAARREFVDKRGWLNDENVLDMITVTQTVPGIIACSCAIFIGWKVDRYRGAVLSLIGAILPSVIIILSLASIIAANKSFTNLPQVQGAFRGVIGAILRYGCSYCMEDEKTSIFQHFSNNYCFMCLCSVINISYKSSFYHYWFCNNWHCCGNYYPQQE